MPWRIWAEDTNKGAAVYLKGKHWEGVSLQSEDKLLSGWRNRNWCHTGDGCQIRQRQLVVCRVSIRCVKKKNNSRIIPTVCVCNDRCWLSTENNFIWSFIGPACLIILVRLQETPPPPPPSQDIHLVFFTSGQPAGFWSHHLQSVPSHCREKAGIEPL